MHLVESSFQLKSHRTEIVMFKLININVVFVKYSNVEKCGNKFRIKANIEKINMACHCIFFCLFKGTVFCEILNC